MALRSKDELALAWKLIESVRLGTLIHSYQSGVDVVPLPWLLSHCSGTYGVLHGHMLKKRLLNIEDADSVVVNFIGPHHYISPAWYVDGSEYAPTWNYTQVQIKGNIHFLTEDELLVLLDKMIVSFEEPLGNPWQYTGLSDALSACYIEQSLSLIAGVTVDIVDVECNFKLSQDKTLENRVSVVNSLKQLDTIDARGIAKFMEE